MPLFEGIRPIDRAQVPTDLVAGVALASLAIPTVMGYAQIAGMPVVTGLYTILVPIALFAILGSSRHLVVGADSATAAILAAGLAGMATRGSAKYVALAAMLAILTAGLLILARLVRLGFLANFLSRTVLIGFLTGVGIQIACGQLAEVLGVPGGTGGTLHNLGATLKQVGDTNGPTLAVSVGVLVVILGLRRIDARIPGPLIAVVGAVAVSWYLDLASDGVAVLGQVPGGLPRFGFPDVSLSQVGTLVPTAVSIFIVVLAQSSATSRAYAIKHNQPLDENVDLIGLGAANLGAGLSGAFVVNGSPTKTQLVDSAGGKSQISGLTTGVIVLVVLLFLTGPLQYMPTAVLGAVVLLIGIELVDVHGMAKIYRQRLEEFTVAAVTAIVVVVVGVEQGIILAIVLSVIIHLRHSYLPRNGVLTSIGLRAWAPVSLGRAGTGTRARAGALPLQREPVLRERDPVRRRGAGDHRPRRSSTGRAVHRRGGHRRHRLHGHRDAAGGLHPGQEARRRNHLRRGRRQRPRTPRTSRHRRPGRRRGVLQPHPRGG